MATETKTFYPGEFLSSASHSGTQMNTGNPIGKSASNTSTFAQFRSASMDYSYVYYRFDVSAIPADATIDSVACTARGGLSSVNSTSSRELYLTTGTTKKTAALTFSASGLYTLNTATWTRAELNDIRILWYWYYSRTTTNHLFFYGADLTVTYTYQSEKFMLKLGGAWHDIARVFKKVNGIWVEQTDLANVIEDGVRYQNGGEYVAPKKTVTVTGTGNSSVAYVTINGTKYTSAASIQVNAGDVITATVGGSNPEDSSITVDGTKVVYGKAGSYNYTVQTDCTVTLSYKNDDFFGTRGNITIAST